MNPTNIPLHSFIRFFFTSKIPDPFNKGLFRWSINFEPDTLSNISGCKPVSNDYDGKITFKGDNPWTAPTKKFSPTAPQPNGFNVSPVVYFDILLNNTDYYFGYPSGSHDIGKLLLGNTDQCNTNFE